MLNEQTSLPPQQLDPHVCAASQQTPSMHDPPSHISAVLHATAPSVVASSPDPASLKPSFEFEPQPVAPFGKKIAQEMRSSAPKTERFDEGKVMTRIMVVFRANAL